MSNYLSCNENKWHFYQIDSSGFPEEKSEDSLTIQTYSGTNVITQEGSKLQWKSKDITNLFVRANNDTNYTQVNFDNTSKRVKFEFQTPKVTNCTINKGNLQPNSRLSLTAALEYTLIISPIDDNVLYIYTTYDIEDPSAEDSSKTKTIQKKAYVPIEGSLKLYSFSNPTVSIYPNTIEYNNDENNNENSYFTLTHEDVSNLSNAFNSDDDGFKTTVTVEVENISKTVDLSAKVYQSRYIQSVNVNIAALIDSSNIYKTFIIGNKGNESATTESFTDTNGVDSFYIGLTNDKKVENYPIESFVNIDIIKQYNEISCIKFDTDFYAKNLKNDNSLAYYSIPLRSETLRRALWQINVSTASIKGIGTLKVKDVFPNNEILENCEDTINTYVNKLLDNYTAYKNIKTLEGEVNNGNYDAQLLALSTIPENDTFKDKVVGLYQLGDHKDEDLLVGGFEYYTKDISADFLQSIFKVDNAKFFDKSQKQSLESLKSVAYHINCKKVENLDMGAADGGDNTFDITNIDKPISRFIAKVTATKDSTIGEIKKKENVVYDYNYLLNNKTEAENKLWIKAVNLTNTVDDFYYKDAIFASGGSTDVPKRIIKEQWIPVKVEKRNNSCFIVLDTNVNIIKPDGKAENLAGQNDIEKFRNGSGMFDMGNSKVVTNNYDEYRLTEILNNLSIKRFENFGYEIFYKNNNTEISTSDVNTDKGIISFKFFLYSFGFSWTKYNGSKESCYANKLCFVSADDIELGADSVKYNFGITKNNLFYKDTNPVLGSSSGVYNNNHYIYYTLGYDNDKYTVTQTMTEDLKPLGPDDRNIVGPFIIADNVSIGSKEYKLSKNKRNNDDNTEYVYDSFRNVAAFRPFKDGDMTSELEYKDDICDTISLDKGFIQDYMLRYKDAYTLVKQLDETGAETSNSFIIYAGEINENNENFIFTKKVSEKDVIIQQVKSNFTGSYADEVLSNISDVINQPPFTASILEADIDYNGVQLKGLKSTSVANNTYVVYKLYIDDTLDKYDNESTKKVDNPVPPIRIDETEFTVNIFPFNYDSRGNQVNVPSTVSQFILYGQTEDKSGNVSTANNVNYIYSKTFTVSSAADEIETIDDERFSYKGIMPILLNRSLEQLNVDFNFDVTSPDAVELLIDKLKNYTLSEKIFNNVKVDGGVSETQAYDSLSLMHVYSENNIKDIQNYTGDAINEKWWKSLDDVIAPLGYTGIEITTASNTIQNIYIGLEPKLIEKQIAVFAQSIYNYEWYLKTANNAIIGVYPNEDYTFEYSTNENVSMASIRVYHHPGINNVGLKTTETDHDVEAINATGNKEDDIESKLFKSIFEGNEKYANKATPEYIAGIINSKIISEYINDDNKYSCLVLNRDTVSVMLTTNGGWMPDPDAIITKRDDKTYPISNKVYMSEEIKFIDDDLLNANVDQLTAIVPKINALRKNYNVSSSNNESSMQLSVNLAAPYNMNYGNLINDADKRYLGITYDLTYMVPVGVHLTEKFTGETTAVNYVNIVKSLTADEWEYGDEKNGVKYVDLSTYTVNIPEKMEKTTYVFKHYTNKYNGEIFDYKNNKVVKGPLLLNAVFEPINYELYLSYLRETDKGANALDTINTELRTFTYEDTLVNFQTDDDGKITENYLARLPATVTGGTKDDCFYKGHILSDGWYLLPEKTRINNVIIEDDEFLEKTFGPKSALCYCEPQTYNIYYIEKLPAVINNSTKIKVIAKQENISYNQTVELLSGNESSSVHGYNELGRYHKVLFPKPFAKPVNDILSAAELGFANNDGISIEDINYADEIFFYGQTARNICGDFSFGEENKTAKVPNVYLEYMYEINDQAIQIKYDDTANTIKTFSVSAVDGKNIDIINFINANNDNAGLQYTNNNTNFFNTDKIFRKYKLMHLNEKNEPERIVFTTGYFSTAPNEFTVTHNDFVQIYNIMLEDPTIYLAPIWESYKYDVEFIYNDKSNTLTLESAKKYILDIGNTSDYIFNISVGSSNDIIDLYNFITDFTNVNAEIYNYYVGWANTNGILRYTAGQAGLTNLVSISKNSTFDNNRKLTSDKLTLQAFFTRRMTNKNGVIFKEGDHYYCDDTKLMLINISNNGFWAIDAVFG